MPSFQKRRGCFCQAKGGTLFWVWNWSNPLTIFKIVHAFPFTSTREVTTFLLLWPELCEDWVLIEHLFLQRNLTHHFLVVTSISLREWVSELGEGRFLFYSSAPLDQTITVSCLGLHGFGRPNSLFARSREIGRGGALSPPLSNQLTVFRIFPFTSIREFVTFCKLWPELCTDELLIEQPLVLRLILTHHFLVGTSVSL